MKPATCYIIVICLMFSCYRNIYIQSDAAQIAYIQQAIIYTPQLQSRYGYLLTRNANATAFPVVSLMESWILFNVTSNQCIASQPEDRVVMAFIWFNNMTSLVAAVAGLSTYVSNSMLAELNDISSQSSQDVATYLIVMISLTAACFILSIWYTRCLRIMTQNIVRYAKKMSVNMKDLTEEKKRSEKLLHQMLPKSLVDRLVNQEPIEAELFSSVTIFFSSIANFQDLSASLQPADIITFLNQIYTLAFITQFSHVLLYVSLHIYYSTLHCITLN